MLKILAKQQNAGELGKLDTFLNGRSDDELCDILEVFWSCDEYKRKLSNDGESIKGDLTFNLANIEDSLKAVKLEGDTIEKDDWAHIAKLMSGTLTFKKIKAFQATAGREGAKWVKESMNHSGETFRSPVDYLSSYFANGGFGFDCKLVKGGERADVWKVFFEECEEQESNQYRAKGVTVSHVLKSTYSTGGSYWVPKVDKGGSWTNQLRMENPLKTKFEESQKTGILGTGIVDEGCKVHQTNLLFGYIPSAASELCKQLS